jgi:peptide/nickel transport system permease protein
MQALAIGDEIGVRQWRGRVLGRFARRNPVAVLAMSGLLLIALMALFAPIFATHDPYFADPLQRLHGPTAAHLMGTDSVGRDVYSRIVYGARTSLGIGLATTVISALLGTLIGLLSGYTGGHVDIGIQRVTEAVQCFPALILAMLVISMFGAGTLNLIVPMTLIFIPSFIRIVRASVIAARQSNYVIAAQSIGGGSPRIIGRHILPNIAAPILVMATLIFGYAILVEASLSFLGLGTQPPHPSWGGMLAGDGRRFLSDHTYLVFFPALVIALTVLLVNLVGDTVRDLLDPGLRGFS